MKHKPKILKIVSLLTCAALLIATNMNLISAFAEEINSTNDTLVYGDINNDGNIDSFDVVAVRQILNSDNTSETYKAADLNGNNNVDAADMYLLQSYVIGKIDSFPIETIEINNNVDRTLALYDGEHYELAMTYEMAVVAEILKTPLNIYDYLSNNIKTEFYPNSRKGAIGTFELNGGNDVDCASLLIAMLNYVGINSRYVTGNITLPIDIAMNITGAHDANSALNIIKFWDTNATLSSDNSSISLAHTWVSSMIEGKEYNLDCSFKQYSYQDTIFDSINEQYDFKGENLNINDVIDEQYTTQTKGYLVDKQIITVNNSQLPEALPYTNEPTSGYDFVTPENSDTVTIILPGGNGLTFLSSELYNSKITLQYEVNHDLVDDEDIGPLYFSSVAEGETIYELMDDYKNDSPLKSAGTEYGDMELVLRIDGQKYSTGTPGYLRKTQNAIVKINTMGQEFEYEKECLVGGTYSVILDYQNMASYKMIDDIKEIDKIKDSVNISNLFKTDNIGRLLELIGDTYYSEFDVYNNMIAEQSDVYLTRSLSVIFAGFEPSITVPENATTPTDYAVDEEGSIVIDAIANCYNMVSRNSDSDMELNAKRASGLMSSQLESSVLDQLFGIQSVSTSNLLRYANKNSIPVHYISNYNKNELDSLSINDNAKDKINERISKGYIITVPETDITINSWTGCGCISYDPQSGFSEYLLSRKTTTFGGCTSSNVKLQEAVAMFFSTTALLSVASWASSALGAISFASVLSFAVTFAIAAVALAFLYTAIMMEIYTIQLIERVEAGDSEALQQLKINNVLDVGMTAIGIAGAISSRACNSCYKEARSIESTEKFGSRAVEGAAKYSDDMADAFRTAEKLEEKGLNKSVISSALEKGDDVINSLSKSDDLVINRLNEISRNGNEKQWVALIDNECYEPLKVKNVDIYAVNEKSPAKLGQNIGELDEVDFVNKIIYEDKTANGLYIDNPTVPQTEAEWADDKILIKTKQKIDAISQSDFNIRINKSGEVSQYSFMVDELKDIKDIRYRINADTPELRKAVEDSINTLKEEYPDYSFSAIFGEK